MSRPNTSIFTTSFLLGVIASIEQLFFILEKNPIAVEAIKIINNAKIPHTPISIFFFKGILNFLFFLF